jgi:hypothetical protein
MPHTIGIESSDVCVNAECGNKLSSFELKRQTKYSIRYYFCIKCRGKGIPKHGDYTNVKCVRCSKLKIVSSLSDSLICKNCLAKYTKYRTRIKVHEL